MENYEFSEVKAPPKSSPGSVWNILTILTLVVTLVIALGFLLIYFNPHNGLNPFPPPAANPGMGIATPTTAPRVTLVPTWTPTLEQVQPTNTPYSTQAPIVTATPVGLSTSTPPTAQATAADYAFALQRGSPAAIDGSQFHPDVGCNWMGVAGQATSLNGEAVNGLFVLLGGSLPGATSIGNLTMTGLAPQYGEGGFEITLSNKPIASNATLWIQLLDQQNLPLSNRIYFSTFTDCTKNLVIIYFDQVH